jgi:hypothetical protein
LRFKVTYFDLQNSLPFSPKKAHLNPKIAFVRAHVRRQKLRIVLGFGIISIEERQYCKSNGSFVCARCRVLEIGFLH